MTHYYRGSNHCVPSLSLSKHTVSWHRWRKSTTALWTSCNPLSASRYRTANPGKFIYEGLRTGSSNSKITKRGGGSAALWARSIKNPVIIFSIGILLHSSMAAGRQPHFESRTKQVKTAWGPLLVCSCSALSGRQLRQSKNTLTYPVSMCRANLACINKGVIDWHQNYGKCLKLLSFPLRCREKNLPTSWNFWGYFFQKSCLF